MIDLDKKIDLESTPLVKKYLLIFLGYFLVGLGILGIFLPILPTTIFFILAAACFLRSSRKNYDRLVNNRLIGRYIRNYIEQKGMSKSSKIISISFLWLTLLISIFIFTEVLWLKILLLTIGIGVTIHILKLRTMTVKSREEDNSLNESIGFGDSDNTI